MKHLLRILMASTIVMAFATGSFAASAKCTVVENAGHRLVLDCGDRGGAFTKGTKIKLKTEKIKQIEGC